MAGQHLIIPPLPQAPPVVPPPPGRVLLANLVPGHMYTLINRHGPNQPLQETFTGRYLITQQMAGGTHISRFDTLDIPNQPPIQPALWRSILDDDWYYVPLQTPAASVAAAPVAPASRRGGKHTKVQRKKRKTKKSRKNSRK